MHVILFFRLEEFAVDFIESVPEMNVSESEGKFYFSKWKENICENKAYLTLFLFVTILFCNCIQMSRLHLRQAPIQTHPVKRYLLQNNKMKLNFTNFVINFFVF